MVAILSGIAQEQKHPKQQFQSRHSNTEFAAELKKAMENSDIVVDYTTYNAQSQLTSYSSIAQLEYTA